MRISNTARSSFPYVLSSEPTLHSWYRNLYPTALLWLYSLWLVWRWKDLLMGWCFQPIQNYLIRVDLHGMRLEQIQIKLLVTLGELSCANSRFQVAATTKMQPYRYTSRKTQEHQETLLGIETNSTDKPSGTLVDANATATITSFSTTDYGWVTVNFPDNFTLSASTTYWLVLKTAAAANDQNYAWAADGSSPATASTMAVSTDGGSTWSAVSAADAYFRVLGNTTEVNCSLITSVGGTQRYTLELAIRRN